MEQRSGCILIKFIKNLDDDLEKSIINEVYKKNRKYIEGMEYSVFIDIKPISTIKSFIKNIP